VDSSRGCLESMSKSKLFGSLIASKYTIGWKSNWKEY
jgi:hypothetical protein